MWSLLLLFRFQFYYYYFVNHTNEEMLFHCDVIFISNRTKLKSSKRHTVWQAVWAGLARQRPNDKHHVKFGSQECRVHTKCQEYQKLLYRSGYTMKLKRFCVPMIGNWKNIRKKPRNNRSIDRTYGEMLTQQIYG